MKVRFSVQADPAWSVWEVCPDVVATGECRYALWCQCRHTDGGPLAAVVKVCPTLDEALTAAEVCESSGVSFVEVSGGTWER